MPATCLNAYTLIRGLEQLGFDLSHYYIDTGFSVIELMDLPEEVDARAFAAYDRMKDAARNIDTSDGITEMRKLAVKIYGKMVG